ncbi:GAMMA-GLUTAMYL PEPTIDASE 5 [Salix viminalis]|uniref:GAMMA-GLUTAMYL PEPTIDASE 5 n=1 Tax=Salix viminalis TaxID=40686 RepID=A0A9Q0NPE5_SALVM|nr:GAMMA-GLUTAMYL PEPTIDASE 5 [Salix viminalis]
MKVTSERRYALFQAARDSDYVKKVHGGYFNVFVKAFAEEGETWDLFRVVEGEFPDMNELHKYDGFVISGSPLRRLWKRLLDSQAVLHPANSGCHGEESPWNLLRSSGFVQSAGWKSWKIVFWLGYWDKENEVWEVPSGAEVIAFSDKTGVEMFAIGDHILGIQGHPEYTKDILHNLIDRLLNSNSIESAFAENAKVRLEIAEPDRKSWEKICRNFLKGR